MGPSLAEQILVDHGIYVGMRSRAEFDKTKGLFDSVIWVDRSEHVKKEPSSSMELTKEDADFVIDNNGSIEDLRVNVRILGFAIL